MQGNCNFANFKCLHIHILPKPCFLAAFLHGPFSSPQLREKLAFLTSLVIKKTQYPDILGENNNNKKKTTTKTQNACFFFLTITSATHFSKNPKNLIFYALLYMRVFY